MPSVPFVFYRGFFSHKGSRHKVKEGNFWCFGEFVAEVIVGWASAHQFLKFIF
jgi:hypothetical protein